MNAVFCSKTDIPLETFHQEKTKWLERIEPLKRTFDHSKRWKMGQCTALFLLCWCSLEPSGYRPMPAIHQPSISMFVRCSFVVMAIRSSRTWCRRRISSNKVKGSLNRLLAHLIVTHSFDHCEGFAFIWYDQSHSSITKRALKVFLPWVLSMHGRLTCWSCSFSQE